MQIEKFKFTPLGPERNNDKNIIISSYNEGNFESLEISNDDNSNIKIYSQSELDEIITKTKDEYEKIGFDKGIKSIKDEINHENAIKEAMERDLLEKIQSSINDLSSQLEPIIQQESGNILEIAKQIACKFIDKNTNFIEEITTYIESKISNPIEKTKIIIKISQDNLEAIQNKFNNHSNIEIRADNNLSCSDCIVIIDNTIFTRSRLLYFNNISKLIEEFNYKQE
jgi:flagellar biosynthesis/type III secretory pathway protein FliH